MAGSIGSFHGRRSNTRQASAYPARQGPNSGARKVKVAGIGLTCDWLSIDLNEMHRGRAAQGGEFLIGFIVADVELTFDVMAALVP